MWKKTIGTDISYTGNVFIDSNNLTVGGDICGHNLYIQDISARNLTGNLIGNADTATTATNATTAATATTATNVNVTSLTGSSHYLALVDGTTGPQGVETYAGLTYNSSILLAPVIYADIALVVGQALPNFLGILYVDFGQVWVNRVVATPTNKTFYVNGTAGGSSSWSSSDDRIKYNETELTSALDTINKLKPRKYEKIIQQPQDAKGTWIPTDAEWINVKDSEDASGNKIWKWSQEIGLIAQDIRNDISDLSFCVEGEELDASGNQILLDINYNNIFTLSIAALQEVDKQLQAEKAKVATLEAKMATLEAENTDLRADIELIKEHLGISTEVG